MESLALPLVIGAVCGLVGGAPYPVALSFARKTHAQSILPGVLAVALSFALLIVAILFVRVLAQDVLLPFVLAMAVGFLVMVVVGEEQLDGGAGNTARTH